MIISSSLYMNGNICHHWCYLIYITSSWFPCLHLVLLKILREGLPHTANYSRKETWCNFCGQTRYRCSSICSPGASPGIAIFLMLYFPTPLQLQSFEFGSPPFNGRKLEGPPTSFPWLISVALYIT